MLMFWIGHVLIILIFSSTCLWKILLPLLKVSSTFFWKNGLCNFVNGHFFFCRDLWIITVSDKYSWIRLNSISWFLCSWHSCVLLGCKYWNLELSTNNCSYASTTNVKCNQVCHQVFHWLHDIIRNCQHSPFASTSSCGGHSDWIIMFVRGC